MIRQSSRYRLSIALGVLLSPAWLWAQGSSVGSITGVVNDPSGSAIPGAAVAIRNINTNQDRQTRTNGSGAYSVTSLPVGIYELKVTAPGFQTLEVKDLKVDVGATLRQDLAMKVGQVSDTVEVAAQAPLLNTENASTGQIIEAKRVTELPLNGRDFQQLQLLSPGTVSGTNFQNSQGLSGGASSLTTTGTMNVSNGGRPGQVLFTSDGSNASNQNGRGIILTPSIDEIPGVQDGDVQHVGGVWLRQHDGERVDQVRYQQTARRGMGVSAE